MSQRRTTPRPPRRSKGRSSSDRAPHHADAHGPLGEGYWFRSTRPLYAFVFLAPLIALYELGSVLYLAGNDASAQQTIQAQRLLADFFETFGVAGLFVPGVAMLTVLFVWHILSGDRWRIEPRYLGGMLIESAAWTLPILVLAAIHSRIAAAGLLPPAAQAPPGDIFTLPWQARLTISIGAGLYEEMLFRLVGIALLHFVFADLLQLRKGTASTLAVVGSALAFALYHDTAHPAGGMDWPKVLFLSAAGIYLGTLYVLRGFGIVVGAHALYDVAVLVLLTDD